MCAPTDNHVLSVASSVVDPTEPHPTPATEAADEITSLHDLDLNAVDNTLAPIQEDLNDAANDAMYPSPPVQSPTSSVSGRVTHRTRGMSTLGDRLIKVSMENRIHHLNSQDGASSSMSVAPSIEEEGSIPIGLGSNIPNPGYVEYFSASSPLVSPIKDNFIGNHGPGQIQEGVLEKSTWEEEVMGDVERALKRLEQLADDDSKRIEGDVAKTAAECFKERLQQALTSFDRKYPVAVKEA